MCRAGYEKLGDGCSLCRVGYYKNMTRDSLCSPCCCFFSVCRAGYEKLGDGCSLCRVGYYKNMTGDSLCSPCGTGFTTMDTGSSSQSLCGMCGFSCNSEETLFVCSRIEQIFSAMMHGPTSYRATNLPDHMHD